MLSLIHIYGVFQYIVLEGEADHQDAIVRTEYAVSTITDQGVPVEKLGYAIANWNRAQANTKMSQLLTEYGDQIELVLSNNDDMALGAVDADVYKRQSLVYCFREWTIPANFSRICRL